MAPDANNPSIDVAGEQTLSYGSGPDSSAAGPSQSTVELSGELGRYKILGRLGEGGMGAVFLAHDSQFDHKVALKVPRFTSADDGQTIQRFYREARAAIKLRHSNLCPVYDVGEISGQHYLVMAYIEGRPLSAFINPSRPLPERQIARLVCKVALALQEAHQNGVIHRDLKPSNIMFDEKRKEPIVMDFGLAAQIGCSEARLTHAGTLIGSPAYMSPEQVRGSGDEIGPPSDIYSLGVILYELLTGRVTFRRTDGPCTGNDRR